MKIFSIAVDGPAGSGKSTVAKAVAKGLDIIYVDTGAMYRALAYYCMQKEVAFLDEEKVIALLQGMDLRIQPEAGGQKIFLNGEDVTAKIRTQAIGQGASEVGTLQMVRNYMAKIQQKMAKEHALIMDGRDIGAYVLPEAEVKIYMDAGVDERARRRMGELMEKGESPVFETVREEIIRRDENDMNRKYNPLRRAEDAVYVDTTEMTIAEAAAVIVKIAEEKLK